MCVSMVSIPPKSAANACRNVRGRNSRGALAALLADGKIQLRDIRHEKYAGRVLATAASSDGTPVAEYLIGKNLARPYSGGKRGGWCS